MTVADVNWLVRGTWRFRHTTEYPGQVRDYCGLPLEVGQQVAFIERADRERVFGHAGCIPQEIFENAPQDK